MTPDPPAAPHPPDVRATLRDVERLAFVATVHYCADLRYDDCRTVCGETVDGSELCCGMDAERLTCIACYRALDPFSRVMVGAASDVAHPRVVLAP